MSPGNTVYILQQEDLISKALPVFIGAFAAFVFSIITLYIANRINTKNTRKQLLNNLSRELKYDLSVISDLKKSIDKVIPKILADEDTPYFTLKYSKFLTNFVMEAYRNGVLFDLLSEYDMAVFDDVISHYGGNGSEPWLRDQLQKLNDKILEKKEVVATFQFERDTLENHTRVINDVLSKIDQYKR